MQIIKSLIKNFLFLLPVWANAQSTWLPQQARDIHFLDRLEISRGYCGLNNFSTLKPYSRRSALNQALAFDSARGGGDRVNAYDLCSLVQSAGEWSASSACELSARKPLGAFYRSRANFFEVKSKDFYLSVNPVLQVAYGKGSADSQSVYLNSRGLTVRGLIANKIGFSSTVIENQERGPGFYGETVRALDAVPGAGYYKYFKGTAFDYFDARGYVSFNATRYIDLQFGFDKNFIGNGYRSLFLSDWGNSYLFLKLNTRIWKLNYQNLFMELMPEYYGAPWNIVLDRKYAAMHHLSLNATRWLNIGLFEGVVFGRKNRFDLEYLNPIIFLRHIEGNAGSPDNAVMGLDAKINAMKCFQFYGQFLIDEFLIKKAMNDPSNWVNKFGFQCGVKYIDALGIKNLDLQLEMNRVRPFTYSHFDSVANYTHYNQPLAHPLGANFQEWIGIARYRPAPRWSVYARGIYYYKGLDSAGRNFGGNIFRDYISRDMENGFRVGSGAKAQCFNGLLKVSYEAKSNLFFEFSVQHRSFKPSGEARMSNTIILGGIRLIMWSREYDF